VAKNDDGEFELILGNRQLLGVFFIVIVLLAVFFTMGYIVGRNSAPLITADANARKTDVKPLVVDSPAPATAPKTEPPPEAAPAAAEPAAQPPETPVKKEKPPEKEKPAPKKEEPPKAQKPPPAPVSSNQPEPGKTYLQLVATRKPDADAMVDLLRRNGFKALDSEVAEKPGLFRVLVGPVPDGELNKTKADLQAKSFPGDHAIPKKF
jgi:hypothetical protein